MSGRYGKTLQNSANGVRRKRLPGRAWTIHALIVVATVGVVTLTAKAPLADVSRLDYFALFGEWSVICTADKDGKERTCAMEAPPLDPHRPRNAIELRQGEDGEPQIGIRRRATVNAATPIFLRIDAHPPHRATATPSGEVVWPAEESTRIIEELRKGNEMVLRTFTGSDNRPRDEFISLSGFEQAWQAYRSQSEQPVPAETGSER